MSMWEVIGPGGSRVVEARDEAEARHLAMVMRWGDVSDDVVPRWDEKTKTMRPYCGYGLDVQIVR